MTIEKYYESELFWVIQKWLDKNDNILLERKRDFRYFVDFIYYLKNDLSNANLINCEGLSNLKNIDEITFTNVHITSDIMEKLGLHYKTIKLPNDIPSFENTIENEKETKLILNETREILLKEDMDYYSGYKRISYVSDIHLMHKLQYCRSVYDIEYVVKNIIKNILENSSRILLIGGDVSSSYEFYKIFISELAKEAKRHYIKVIFILGNHELWDFAGDDLTEIVEEYRDLIKSNNMYFIQNNILYVEDE